MNSNLTTGECQFVLEEFHDIFKGEMGDTSVVEMDIDTG